MVYITREQPARLGTSIWAGPWDAGCIGPDRLVLGDPKRRALYAVLAVCVSFPLLARREGVEPPTF
jgi:hypothetical protein